jgi:hypothetical protein
VIAFGDALAKLPIHLPAFFARAADPVARVMPVATVPEIEVRCQAASIDTAFPGRLRVGSGRHYLWFASPVSIATTQRERCQHHHGSDMRN